MQSDQPYSDHPGKTVLHSLELEHVLNCDTMQQGVAVVKPTAHKSRRLW